MYLLTPGFSRDLPAPPSTAITMALHGYLLPAGPERTALVRVSG